MLRRQCDLAQTYDTIGEAKQRMHMVPNGKGKEHYLFSRRYQEQIVASEPLRYAQIPVDGVCLYDYFAKGYNGDDREPEPYQEPDGAGSPD